ncbi:MAG: hypothetical protein WD404_07385 [Solirubrobacterales bacterium]
MKRSWGNLGTLAQIATVVGFFIGLPVVLVTLGVIQPLSGSSSSDGSSRNDTKLARFEGVAGHLAESTALLSFLDQHNREAVQLDVGFTELRTTPAGSPNVGVERVPYEGGTLPVPRSIALMTDCVGGGRPNGSQTEREPCNGTVLILKGDITSDSSGHFEHGVPVIEGYFLVDVTGGLYMGMTPILLRPLTFEQATGLQAD